MSTILSSPRFAGLVGSVFLHVAAVVVGFVLMIVGLGLGVTIIMLPVGLVVGIAGLIILHLAVETVHAPRDRPRSCLPVGLGGHRVKAGGRALSQRAVEGVAQVQEPGERGGAPGERGGLEHLNS